MRTTPVVLQQLQWVEVERDMGKPQEQPKGWTPAACTPEPPISFPMLLVREHSSVLQCAAGRP